MVMEVEGREAIMEYPVVLYNGERQIKVGSIDLHPTFEFKEFRTKVSEMVGVSYNNLTTYFVDNDRMELPLDDRKLLITGKVDLSTFGSNKQKGYFHVVVKPSRKERHKKLSKQAGLTELSVADLFDFRSKECEIVAPTIMPAHDKVEIWLQELEMNKKAYNYNIQNLEEQADDLYMHTNANFPSINEAYPEEQRPKYRPLCLDCSKADRQGKKPSFHFCRYDKILQGVSRPLYGPIARPQKNVCRDISRGKFLLWDDLKWAFHGVY